MAIAGDAEQANSHNSAQEVNKRLALEQQPAVMQQMWLLSGCIFCFAITLSNLTVTVDQQLQQLQQSAYSHILLLLHAQKAVIEL